MSKEKRRKLICESEDGNGDVVKLEEMYTLTTRAFDEGGNLTKFSSELRLQHNGCVDVDDQSSQSSSHVWFRLVGYQSGLTIPLKLTMHSSNTNRQRRFVSMTVRIRLMDGFLREQTLTREMISDSGIPDGAIWKTDWLSNFEVKKFLKTKWMQIDVILFVGSNEVSVSAVMHHLKLDQRVSVPYRFLLGVQSMVSDNDFEMIKIVVNENDERREFNILKKLLIACSEVFAKTFECEAWIESNTRSVEVKNYPVEVVETFLKALQSGKVEPTSTEESSQLLAIANQYQVEWIKSEMEDKLCTEINAENCVLLLSAAGTYEASNLYAACFDFVISNIEVVSETSGWLEVYNKNMSVIVSVLSRMAGICDPGKML